MEVEGLPIKEDEVVKILNPKIKIINNTNLNLIRIQLNDDYTIIDFIYHATNKYENGGWVQISSHTFIRPVGSNQKLRLIKAVNIPFAPTKHFFKTTKDMLAYTLYFPSLPKDCSHIDIIEREDNSDGTWFNFYGVSMESIKSNPLIIIN